MKKPDVGGIWATIAKIRKQQGDVQGAEQAKRNAKAIRGVKWLVR